MAQSSPGFVTEIHQHQLRALLARIEMELKRPTRGRDSHVVRVADMPDGVIAIATQVHIERGRSVTHLRESRVLQFS